MKFGIIISLIVHCIIAGYVLINSTQVSMPATQRFIRASVVRFEPQRPEPAVEAEALQQPSQPETTVRQEPVPRFERPEERYEQPKDTETVLPEKDQETKPKPETPVETVREPVIPAPTAPVRVLEQDFQSSYYLGLLMDKVYRNWRIQDRPFRMECIVRFQIARDGSIFGVRLEQSSGFHDFDRASMRAVTDSDPFPSLPPTYTRDHLTVYFRFENY